MSGRSFWRPKPHPSAVHPPRPSAAAPTTSQSITKNTRGLSLLQQCFASKRNASYTYTRYSSAIPSPNDPSIPMRVCLYLPLTLPPLLQLSSSTRKQTTHIRKEKRKEARKQGWREHSEANCPHYAATHHTAQHNPKHRAITRTSHTITKRNSLKTHRFGQQQPSDGRGATIVRYP